jgi:hypothetical protein
MRMGRWITPTAGAAGGASIVLEAQYAAACHAVGID